MEARSMKRRKGMSHEPRHERGTGLKSPRAKQGKLGRATVLPGGLSFMKCAQVKKRKKGNKGHALVGKGKGERTSLNFHQGNTKGEERARAVLGRRKERNPQVQ